MSVEKQQFLKYIPIANFLTVFFWVQLCYKMNVKHSQFLGELLKMFVCVIGYAVIQIVMTTVCPFPILTAIVTCASVYAFLFSISWLSIRAQIRILENY